jgi:hypothetical protein
LLELKKTTEHNTKEKDITANDRRITMEIGRK